MFAPPKIIDVNGRELAIEVSGPDHGFPLLMHSGTGSRHLFPGAVRDAERAGFRLISYDRPGLGLSQGQRGRTIADSIDDVQAIVEALNIDRLAVWGSSAGGPYALATVTGLGDIVSSFCLFAPIGPFGTDGLDFTEGMDVGADFHDEIALLFDDPRTARTRFLSQATEMLEYQGSPDWWTSRWGDRARTEDAYSAEWAEYLAACAIDGYAEGGEGWWEDWYASFLPWGFDTAHLDTPGSLWHGLEDAMVPETHARWYETNVPRLEFHLEPNIDHTNIDEKYRWAAMEWTLQHSSLG